MSEDRIHSRRDVLRSAMALGGTAMVSGVLSACGGSSSSTGGSSTSAGGGAQVTAKQVSEASGTINYLGWQFYQVPEMDSGPVKAHWTYIGNVGQLISAPKLPNAFDVYNPGAGIMPPYFAEKAIAPIPTHLLGNYEKIPAWLRDYFVFNGQVYGVPLAVTPSMVSFDTARVPPVTSINDLLKPEYKGLIGLYDNDEEVIPAVGRGLGIDLFKPLTHDELTQCMNFLNKLKPQVKTFYETGGEVQLYQNGDIAVAFLTFGSLVTASQKARPKVKYNYLDAINSIDCLSVTPWADLPKSIAWIDHQITVPVQTAIAKHSGANPVVPGASTGLSGPGVLPLEKLKAFPPNPNLPVKESGDVVTEPELQQAWTSYKQSF
jgi:spermidine/putrescine-binding protein